MYMPTQSFDPAGAMYNPSGFRVALFYQRHGSGH
jgi:hypothetical protein